MDDSQSQKPDQTPGDEAPSSPPEPPTMTRAEALKRMGLLAAGALLAPLALAGCAGRDDEPSGGGLYSSYYTRYTSLVYTSLGYVRYTSLGYTSFYNRMYTSYASYAYLSMYDRYMSLIYSSYRYSSYRYSSYYYRYTSFYNRYF